MPSHWDGADSSTGTVCHECNIVQPLRSHHCSICGKCVARRDHHNVWIGACIGHKNLKIVVLFLFYSLLLSTFVATTMFFSLRFASFGGLHVGMRTLFLTLRFFVVAIVASAAAVFSLGLCAAALWLTLSNSTYFEATQRARRFGWVAVITKNAGNLYKLSRREAWAAVFGRRLWLLPVPPVGNGDGTQFRMTGV